MEIRIADLNDSQNIQKIYAPYVQNTNITFEYVVPSVEEMNERIKKTLKEYPYIVAVENGCIVGYAYASQYRTRQAYDWDSELSIYIHQDYHGMGIGKKLYQVLLSLLKIMNIQNVYTCITSPNLKSEIFHQSLGFQLIGQLTNCGYKFEKWHDVIWMEKSINDAEDVKQVIPFSALTSKQIEICLHNSYVQEGNNVV